MLPRSIALVLALIASLAAIGRPAQAKDELVIGLTQYPSTWNPLIGAMLAKSLIQNMTARPFTAYDPEWKLVCMLCTELPTLENGKARVIDLPEGKKGMEIDFTIQPEAKWGDGTPVTVKDVEFTIEFGKHPQSGVTSAESYRRILKIAARDEKSFTMTVDRVTYDYNSTALLLLPAHIEKPVFEASPLEYRNKNSYDTNIANPGLYFGPYRIVSATPGSQVVLERNPTWWGPQPFFRRIVVRTIENSSALEANLLSGSVDYILGELGLSIEQAIAFEKRHKDRFIVEYKPALIYEHIDVNLDVAILKDLRVRQALMYGMDRQAISTRLFEGKQPVAQGGISPLDPMYSKEARDYAFDPAKARALLDEAGWRDIRNGVRHNTKGERLSIELATTAGNRSREQVQQVLQSQWRQIGIDVRLKAEPPRVFFAETMNKRAFGGLAIYAWVTRPEGVPRTTLHSNEIPTAANNWSGQNHPGYRNPEMDSALDAAERELDPAKRRALFAVIQRLYADDLPVLPLYHRADAFIFPKQLKGVRPTGHLNSSTLWIEEWRWE